MSTAIVTGRKKSSVTIREIRGRAIAQAVSCLLPTQGQFKGGFSGGYSDTGAGFLRVHRFPLPSIPATDHPSPAAGTIGQ
jgi:hypothetical protein